jgi:hypothetical protein
MTGFPYEEVLQQLQRVRTEEVWMNETYQVNVRRGDVGDLVHLSIKRRDKQPVTDWRDKQAMKNQLVGPECEGIELYPAESRLVDGANQYHLWCSSDPAFRFPVGWDTRHVSDGSGGGAVQRPRNIPVDHESVL